MTKFLQTKMLYFLAVLVFLGSTIDLSAQKPMSERIDDAKQSQNHQVPKKIDESKLKQTAMNLTTVFKTHKMNNYLPTIDQNSYKHLNTNININAVSSITEKYPNLNIFYNTTTSTPKFISNFPESSNKNNISLQSENVAYNFLIENKTLIRIDNPKEELICHEVIDNKDGLKHIKYLQTHKNIPIWGRELYVHLNEKNDIYLINSSNIPTVKDFAIPQNILSEKQSIEIANNNLSKLTNIEYLAEDLKKLLNYSSPEGQQYIWIDDNTQKPYLAYFIRIRPNIKDNWCYFVDAVTGNILEKYNSSQTDTPTTGTGKDIGGTTRTFNVTESGGKYYMYDISRPMFNSKDPKNITGAIITYDNQYKDLNKEANPQCVNSSSKNFSDPAAVSMHYALGLVYDYYKNTHNRNSIDNNGMTMFSIIHVTNNGETFDNAYWNGQFTVFGDGGDYCKPWPGALDFIAHEWTHGVVTHTVDLEYKFESGALNEAFADWGGAMLDRDDWKLGEDIAKTSAYKSGAVRDMSNPHNQGSKGDFSWLPAHMNEFMQLTIDQDNGGVHYNCGIINKATYLIGTDLGKDKLEKIYYRVLNNRYLTKQAKFIDMRLACVKSAEELYGKNSNEVNKVKSAFDQVGITDGNGTKPDNDFPSINGNDFIAMIYAGDYKLYVGKGTIKDINTDVGQFSMSQVYAGNNGVISVTDDGSGILFIDTDFNIRYLNTEVPGEEYILSDLGIWSSIAISPNGKYLAATSKDAEPIIYIFNLVDESFKAYELYTPNTSDNEDSYIEPLYPGNIDWNITSNMLIYDAANYRYNFDGTEDIHFDINILDPSNGVITRVFPPMEKGIHIGTPSFAQTSPYCVSFEVYNDNEKSTSIMAANLYDGNVALLAESTNPKSIMSPTYSPDDKFIAFQLSDYSTSQTTYSILKIPIASNKISSSGNIFAYLTNVGIPKWFAVGKRAVDVEDDYSDNEINIYPNPFKSEGINIELNDDNVISLEIINSLGEVIRCFNNVQSNMIWDGMDQNGNIVPNGIYYLIIHSNVGSKSIPIVKMM